MLTGCNSSDDGGVTSDVGYQDDEATPVASAQALLLGKPYDESGLDVYNARANSEVVLTGKDSDSPYSPILEFNWLRLDDNGYEVSLVQKTRNTVGFDAPNVTELTRFIFELTVVDGNNNRETDTVAVDVYPIGDADHFLSHPTKEKSNQFFVKAVLDPSQSIGANDENIVIEVTEIIHWENRLKEADSLILNTYKLEGVLPANFTSAYSDSRSGTSDLDNPLFIINIPRIDADNINKNFETTEVERRLEPYLFDDASIEIQVKIIDDSGHNITLYSIDHNDQIVDYSRIDYKQNPTQDFLANSSSPTANLSATDLLDSLGIENSKSAARYYDLLDGSKDGRYDRLEGWLINAGFMDEDENWTSTDYAHALYVNNYDLGFARDMYSRKDSNGNIYSFVVNYPSLESGILGIGEFALVAMEYSDNPDPNQPNKIVKFFAYIYDSRVGGFKLARSLNFDGRGEKYVPGACTGCHQGDSAGKDFLDVADVDLGATFIPWDVSSFVFVDANNERFVDHTVNLSEVSEEQKSLYKRENQEDDIRRLNEHALTTYQGDKNRFSASIELVHGWYGSDGTGDSLPSNATFDDNYVQPGWIGQEELYHGAYAQYCRVCHTQMADPAKTFSTYDSFINKRDLIEEFVYERGVMPLARLTMDRFWLNYYGETPAADILKAHIFSGKSDTGDLVPGKPAIKVTHSAGEEAPLLGDTIQLDARTSAMSESYFWAFSKKPENSNSTIKGVNNAHAEFTVDVPGGEYIISLTATNENGLSHTEYFSFTVDDRAPIATCINQAVTISNKGGTAANIDIITQILNASPNIDDDTSLLDYEGDGSIIVTDTIAGTFGELQISADGLSVDYVLYDTFSRGNDELYYRVSDNDGSLSSTEETCDNSGNIGYGKLSIQVLNQNDADILPVNINATLDNINNTNQINLSWNKPDTVDPDSYRIYVTKESVLQPGYIEVNAPLTTYSHNGLEANTRYSYTVTAIEGTNESQAVSAGLAIRTRSLDINNLSPIVSSTTDEISFTWDKPEGNESGYDIYLDNDLLNPIIIDSTDLDDANNPSYTLTGLTPGHNYQINIAGKDGINTSSASSAIFIAPIPSTPNNLLLSAGLSPDTSINLNWDDATGERVSYKVYRQTSGGDANFEPVDSDYIDSGLTPFKYYTYYITAVNAQGLESSASNTEIIQTSAATGETVFPSISSIALGSNDASEVVLSITPASSFSATGYRLYRYLGSGTSNLDQAFDIGLPSGNYTDTNLTHNTLYTYELTAYYDRGDGMIVESPTDTAQSITTQSLNITNLQLSSNTPTGITISWDPATANSVSYELVRTLEGGFDSQFTATSPYNDSVIEGSNYQYQVSITQGSQSIISTSSAISTAPASPNAPAVSGNGSSDIDISWVAPDADLGYTYDVDVSEDDINWSSVISGSAVLSTTDSGKDSGKTYYYRVRAIKNGAASQWSPSASDSTASLIPSNLQATTNSTNSIELSWDAPAGASVSQYIIVRDGIEIDTSSSPVTTTSYTDTGKNPGQNHSYAIKADDGTQVSAESNSINKASLPDSPTGLSTMNGPTPTSEITLTWSAAANPAVTSAYNIYYSDGSFIAQTSNTSYTVTGLNSFKAYNFYVKAVNSDNEESLTQTSTARHITFASGSTTVSGLTAALDSTNNATEVDLSWTKPTEYNPSNYRIRRYQSADTSGPSTLINLGSSATTYSDTGRDHNTDYTYEVEAYYDEGDGTMVWSSASATNSIKTRSLVVAAPSRASAPSTTQVNLSWSAPAANVDSTNGYSLYRNGSFVKSVTGTTTSDSGLTEGTSYTYEIIANQNGESSTVAQTAESTLHTAPNSPTGLGFNTSTTSQVNVTWSAPDGDGGYTYTLLWRQNGAGSWNTINSATSPYPHSGRSSATQYDYRVIAIKNGEQSTETGTQTKATLPNAPSSLVATRDGSNPTSTLDVDWANSGASFTYELQRATNTGFSSNLQSFNTGTTSALANDNTSTSSGTQYYYRVRTSRYGETSAWSSTASVATQPNKPSSITLTRNSTTQFTVSWNDNAAGDYTVYIDGLAQAQDGSPANNSQAFSGKTYQIGGYVIEVTRTRNGVESEKSTNYANNNADINDNIVNTRVDFERDIGSDSNGAYCTGCHAAAAHQGNSAADKSSIFPACVTTNGQDCSAGGGMGWSDNSGERELIEDWVSEGSIY